jgi:uncharacterized protein Yka (UPF0111/DUF47 family)
MTSPDPASQAEPSKKPSALLRLVHKVFPVAPDFYALLNAQCELAVRTTEALVEFMREANPDTGQKVRDLEHEGDDLKRQNLDILNRSFSTTFDREDIDRGIRSIDEILNYAKTTVREVEALGVDPDEDMLQMALRIHEGAQALCRGYRLLGKDAEAAQAEAYAAHKAERNTEKIYRRALSRLLDDDRLTEVVAAAGDDATMQAVREVVRIFRRREVFRHLSNSADVIALAGNYLHDTIVKAI